jgi:hypothetical protein
MAGSGHYRDHLIVAGRDASLIAVHDESDLGP